MTSEEKMGMCKKLSSETGCDLLLCQHGLIESNWCIEKAKCYIADYLNSGKILK